MAPDIDLRWKKLRDPLPLLALPIGFTTATARIEDMKAWGGDRMSFSPMSCLDGTPAPIYAGTTIR